MLKRFSPPLSLISNNCWFWSHVWKDLFVHISLRALLFQFDTTSPLNYKDIKCLDPGTSCFRSYKGGMKKYSAYNGLVSSFFITEILFSFLVLAFWQPPKAGSGSQEEDQVMAHTVVFHLFSFRAVCPPQALSLRPGWIILFPSIPQCGLCPTNPRNTWELGMVAHTCNLSTRV